MLNWSLLENLLIIAIACSSITVILIQKTKKFCNNSTCVIRYSFFINLIFGFFFCYTFTNIGYLQSLWVGLFSFLGADTIFKNLEGKLSSYSELMKPLDTTVDSDSSQKIEENNTEPQRDIIGEITYE